MTRPTLKFRNAVATACARHGYSYRVLANRAGMSATSVHALLTAKSPSSPSLDNAARIATAVGLKLKDVL